MVEYRTRSRLFVGIDERILVGAGDAIAGARFFHAFGGQNEVEVVRQRAGDELLERLVGKQGGPFDVSKRRLAWGGLAAIPVGDCHGRPLVIRSHGASGEQGDKAAPTWRGLQSAAPRLFSVRRVEKSLDPAGKSACATSLDLRGGLDARPGLARGDSLNHREEHRHDEDR